MEWPKRARTADWENGVLALDREKQFEVPKLTSEIMERLAGYTLVGFHVKGYPVTDELLAPFAGHKSMVNFGVENLRVHSKITHIGMKNGLDIACISTGNFHEGNARVYTDYLLMTAARNVVRDVNSVFTFIEKPYVPVSFKELLVSPNEMKKRFLRLIDNEIKNRQQGKPAYIRVKINHITDTDMVRKLYEASASGVPVDLLVRGNCSLVTGIPPA